MNSFQNSNGEAELLQNVSAGGGIGRREGLKIP